MERRARPKERCCFYAFILCLHWLCQAIYNVGSWGWVGRAQIFTRRSGKIFIGNVFGPIPPFRFREEIIGATTVYKPQRRSITYLIAHFVS